MNIYMRELKSGIKSFLIWTISIGALVAICIFMYPEMEGMMGDVNDIFSSMGAFSAAFGMDRLGLGTLLGFYSVECGTMLTLGAALYAAMAGTAIVGKEEKGRTAEFLFAMPVSRRRVLSEKLGALMTEMMLFHIVNFLFSIVSIVAIGEEIPVKDLLLLHSSYLFMTIAVASLCFLLSVFNATANTGSGMGLALAMYFINLMANISDKAKALSWVTPFSFTEGADIVLEGKLDGVRIILWMGLSIVAIASGFAYYSRKDLKS